MPYGIKVENGNYVVYKKDDGHVMGRHKTRDKAKAQIAAIHTNEKKKGS